MKNRPGINFDQALARGHRSYNSHVGRWWHDQAQNSAHRKAYQNIAAYLKQGFGSGGRPPRFIVDYACGNGAFLLELARQFPESRLVGVDGSEKMLSICRERFQNRGVAAELYPAARSFEPGKAQVRLVKSVLPNFSLPEGRADAAAFLFPNLTCAPRERLLYQKGGFLNRRDVKVAEMLARFREMDPEDEIESDDGMALFSRDEIYADLMTSKVISRNLRHLLKKGGSLIRVDYANALREELTDLTLWRTLFCEGALETPVKGLLSEQIFKFRESRYYRSSVILDVFHQTGDPTDKLGGYFASLLKAI